MTKLKEKLEKSLDKKLVPDDIKKPKKGKKMNKWDVVVEFDDLFVQQIRSLPESFMRFWLKSTLNQDDERFRYENQNKIVTYCFRKTWYNYKLCKQQLIDHQIKNWWILESVSKKLVPINVARRTVQMWVTLDWESVFSVWDITEAQQKILDSIH